MPAVPPATQKRIMEERTKLAVKKRREWIEDTLLPGGKGLGHLEMHRPQVRLNHYLKNTINVAGPNGEPSDLEVILGNPDYYRQLHDGTAPPLQALTLMSLWWQMQQMQAEQAAMPVDPNMPPSPPMELPPAPPALWVIALTRRAEWEYQAIVKDFKALLAAENRRLVG